MRATSTLPRRAARALTLGGALALASCAGSDRGEGGVSEVVLRTVPTPAPYVSGAETLVLLEAPNGTELSELRVTLEGVDVTGAFRAPPPDRLGRPRHALLGLVEGLRPGENRLAAAIGGAEVAALTVTAYPVTGPIFSGPHLEPYLCLDALSPGANGAPRRFPVGNGAFLEGPPLDEHCSYPTRVDHLYRAVGEGAGLRPLPDPANLPADIERIVQGDGSAIPFVVRLETGTINRAIYQFAAVVDPANPNPDPWSPPAGWNGRLIYTFGGGCEAGFFQGTSTGGVLSVERLAAGYALASSTLNVNSQGGCNDPLSAETAMMVKERFAEVFGPPLHTIGSGGSGGAMQQLLIAGAYPGILDGILPTLTFPDAVTNFIDATECSHLIRGFLNDRDLEDETKRSVGGWAVWETCDRSLAARPNRIAPYDCPDIIPDGERYDPFTNPTGIRCSIYDGMRNVFGARRYSDLDPVPVAAFGRNPHDNVGVQYGLLALNEGRITKELFLDLNEGIGGWDADGQWRAARTEGDLDAIRIAYETGRVTSGTGGLAFTPIIDERSYIDPSGDFHQSFYSFATRARLIRDLGDADNYVLIRRGAAPSPSSLAWMDEWLTKLALDGSNDPQRVKVIRAKPAGLTDACWDAEGNQIVEPQRFDMDRLFDNTEGRCNSLFPPHTGPRLISGGPLANDVFKCQLKPLDRADYEVEFTEAEWTRLGTIFPDGVCDWSKPGVGQVAQVGTWLSYGPSTLNRYP